MLNNVESCSPTPVLTPVLASSATAAQEVWDGTGRGSGQRGGGGVVSLAAISQLCFVVLFPFAFLCTDFF